MKKFFYLLLSSVLAFAFTSCSNDDHEDVGGNNNSNESKVEAILGDYHSLMVTTLKEMSGDPTKAEGTLKITAAGGNKVNVVLPQLAFGSMVLPSVTLNELEVAQEQGTYSFAKEVSSTIQVDGADKKYTVKFNGKVNADGSYEFNEEMKYGNMPFTLMIRYTKYSLAARLAGTYATDLEAVFKENPAMGVMLSGKAELRFEVKDDTHLSLVLPELKSGKMAVPSLTLNEVTVLETEDGYTLTGSFEGEDAASGKSVVLKFNGKVESDGTFLFNEELKFGSMPMTFSITYKPQAK